MSPILANRQAEELHKSIIAYLSANDLPNAAAALRAELKLSEEAFDSATMKKYETLLEKKWTSIARLQRKIMDLESHNAALQSELDNASLTTASKRNKDPASWLPTLPARYTLESHRSTINCLAFHPKFSSIASGSDDCMIKVWDWELGELERTLKGHTRAVLDVDYGGAQGSIILASCSSDLSIKLWDPADGYKNIRTLVGHDHSISAVRFIPGGNLLASASRDKDLRIWDSTTGFCVKAIQGHSAWVRDVCPSFDGNFLLSTGDDMSARLWDISNLMNPDSKLTMVGHDHVIECCAIAPATTYQYLAQMAGLKKNSTTRNAVEFMATGSRDKTIKVWDARGTCLMTLVGHDNWVRAILFHPGGKYLLSVSDDRTLRCWDLSQDGKCVKTLSDAHGRFITCLKWAPGIVKDAQPAADGQAAESNGTLASKTAGDNAANVQIRCVIATGSVDETMKIFAS
ncbi:nuclear distribution protein nudF 1 [Talaromyces proteolyticus]|uniref:Nuclear distribution protein nudF n=1 Tax=Talaromyces proteolyticus TaxID=1131652 RepID=A0AAD4KMT3_9EURO|nr:nuclear distribution protein nudF 1 [Talaromyces proteolyticus]KAH8692072.1 nuclear distribution protein nudF 1 [Talaromyces proteolyticus]